MAATAAPASASSGIRAVTGSAALWRFVTVSSTVAAIDAGNAWAYLQHGEAQALQRGPGWARALGIEVTEMDVTAGGSRLLLATRMASALLTALLTVHLYMTDNYPLVESNYGYTLHVKRWRRFTTFTCWCWLLLTVYFGLAVHASLVGDGRSAVLPVLFEVCLSTAVLVTLVVHFVLIPMARRKDQYRLSRLLNWRSLVLHYANVSMMGLEALLSGLPMRYEHWVFPLLYCNAYLCFAWAWHYHSGVFYYFFMDYTKHWWSPAAYLGLFFVFAALWVACTWVVQAAAPLGTALTGRSAF